MTSFKKKITKIRRLKIIVSQKKHQSFPLPIKFTTEIPDMSS